MTPHVFRIPGFDLKPAQILENVPSPVLAKSPTGIGQNANRYWPNRQPVLAKSPTCIDEFDNTYIQIMHILFADILKSLIGIDEITNR